jgi:methionyl-tRNA synthetase
VNDAVYRHAYTTVAADVLLATGARATSSFSPPMNMDKSSAGRSRDDPQTHCDKLALSSRPLKRPNISNDAFIRTSDPPHKSIVQRYLQELGKQLIYKDDYTDGTAHSMNGF